MKYITPTRFLSSIFQRSSFTHRHKKIHNWNQSILLTYFFMLCTALIFGGALPHVKHEKAIRRIKIHKHESCMSRNLSIPEAVKISACEIDFSRSIVSFFSNITRRKMLFSQKSQCTLCNSIFSCFLYSAKWFLKLYPIFPTLSPGYVVLQYFFPPGAN